MQQDTVEVYLDHANEFRWRRQAPNGRIVADCGEGYRDLADCLDTLIRVNGRPWQLQLLEVPVPPIAEPLDEG